MSRDGNDGSSESPDIKMWTEIPNLLGVPESRREFYKIRYQKQIEADFEQFKDSLTQRRADHEAELAQKKALDDWKRTVSEERERSDRAPYYAFRESLLNTYISATVDALNRAQTRAEYVEKAATAIAGLYTGILAFTYFVKDDISKSNPLPERGVWAVVFLGLAVVFAIGYMAFLTDGGETPGAEHRATIREDEMEEVKAFIRWASAMILKRRNFLHAAIVSLAIGVGFLPVPFLDVSNGHAKYGALAGLVLVVLIFALSIQFEALIEKATMRRNRNNSGTPVVPGPPDLT